MNTIASRGWELLAYGSTLWTRAGLAFCSTLWSVFLLLPGETMGRPVYRYMAILFGPYSEFVWAALFGTHALGMWWRTLADHPAPVRVSLAINLLGVSVYCYTALSIMLTRTAPFPAAIAADVGCALAAILVAIRTHINPDRGWKCD